MSQEHPLHQFVGTKLRIPFHFLPSQLMALMAVSYQRSGGPDSLSRRPDGPSFPPQRPQTPAPANPARRRKRRLPAPDCLQLHSRQGTPEAKRLAFGPRPRQSAPSRTPSQPIRILTQPTFSHRLGREPPIGRKLLIDLPTNGCRCPVGVADDGRHLFC